MTHHPDCLYWFENYPAECTCGLSAERPEWSKQEPWSRGAFDAWAAQVRRTVP